MDVERLRVEGKRGDRRNWRVSEEWSQEVKMRECKKDEAVKDNSDVRKWCMKQEKAETVGGNRKKND